MLETVPVIRIQEVICEHFGITRAQLLTRRRRDCMALARARQIGMYLSRELTYLSYPQIGMMFLREHTTVLHGCRAVEQRMRADRDVADLVADLTSRLINPNQMTLSFAAA